MKIIDKGTRHSRNPLLSEEKAGSQMTAPIPHMERVNVRIHILRGVFFKMKAPPAAKNDATIRISVKSSIDVNNDSDIS